MNKDKILLAIASLVISLLLWMQVQPIFEPGKEIEFPVKMSFENLPPGHIVTDIPDSVMVFATGTDNDLDTLQTEGIEAIADLARIQPGESTVPIRMNTPALGEIFIQPKRATVKVIVEELLEAESPVQLQQVGSLSSDLVLEDETIRPTRVALSGPRSAMQKVDRAQVSLPMTSVKPGSTYTLEVEVLDAEGKPLPLVQADPSEVTVIPTVVPASQSKVVPITVNWVGNLPRGYQLKSFQVEPNTIRLQGSSESLNRIFELATAELNLDSVTASKSQKLSLTMPEGVTSDVSEVLITLEIVRSSG